MGKDPAFLFYPGDYLRDTQTLSEKAQVAYDRIICEHMRNICIRHAQLNFFTKRLSEQEIAELKMVLKETAEGFQIEWVADSIMKRKAYSESRKINRAGKGKKHMNDICKSYVEHMENENVIIKDKESMRGKGKIKSVQIPLPASLILTDDMKKYAYAKGVHNPAEEFEAFKTWAKSIGKTYVDWEAGWRTRCNNYKKFNKSGYNKPEQTNPWDYAEDFNKTYAEEVKNE